MSNSNTSSFKLLSIEEKHELVKEIWLYHDFPVRNDCAFAYCERFDVAIRTLTEQISKRRRMRQSQLDFVIDFLISEERISERGIREVFRRLFGAEPEAYGYLLQNDPLPLDEEKATFLRWKRKELTEKQPV